SGGFCGSTVIRSYVTPLAAITKRTRWQSTSSAEENSVRALRMRGLAAIIEPSPATGFRQPQRRRLPLAGGRPVSFPSVHVPPVFLLQQPGEEREQGQEQHHPHADALALE